MIEKVRRLALFGLIAASLCCALGLRLQNFFSEVLETQIATPIAEESVSCGSQGEECAMESRSNAGSAMLQRMSSKILPASVDKHPHNAGANAGALSDNRSADIAMANIP